MIYVNRNRHISTDEWESVLEQFGLIEKIRMAETISIKPNLAAGNKAPIERHVCTDRELLINIVDVCHHMNPFAKIYIVESDSTGNGFAYLKFEHFDYPNSVDPEHDKNVDVLDLSRTRLKEITDERFLYFKNGNSLFLSEPFMDSDFVISLSNLKTHSVTLYTGACKNLFGCLPASTKSVYHPYIHEIVHDLTLAIHPDLNIVDAFFAMEKNGPVAGNDIDGGFRLFSDNAYEADIYGSTLIGIGPDKVKYLKYLSKTYKDITIDKGIIEANKFSAVYPGRNLRVNNTIGLCVQRFGDGISDAGDRLHIAKNPIRAIIAIFRPLLIKIFGLGKLKKFKGKFQGDSNNGY